MKTIFVTLATCTGLLASVPSSAQLRLQVVASGFARPVAFIQDPSNSRVQYVVEQGGRIRVMQDGVTRSVDFLDLSAAITSDGERGLLGLAFPPDYGTSGRFYVNFTNLNGDTVIARYRRSAANLLVADPGSRFDFQWPSGQRFIAQPFANHNGGNIVFGPDGYMYIGMGDGGSGNDPGNLAQDPNSLLGKMLRIDVNVPDADTRGYRVPSDNPFVGGAPIAALGEIWAFGLRNPWRFSFDDPARGGTGALVVGDVGQNGWEEVDYEPAGLGGRNYGWRIREGAHDNVTTAPPAYSPLRDPIFEYDHSTGPAVTGGYVYRGRTLGPTFAGRYFFADFGGRLWSLALNVDPATREAVASGLVEHTAELGGSAALGLISSMGVDAAGEIYILNWGAGQVLRLAKEGFVRSIWPPRGLTIGWTPIEITGSFQNGAAAVTFGGVPALQVTVHDSSRLTALAPPHAPGLVDVAVTTGGETAVVSRGFTYANILITPAPAPRRAAADLDGDGATDVVVWRPDQGTWFGLPSSGTAGPYMAVTWGVGAEGDVPVLGDYDGDGKGDPAVWRAPTGTWWILPSGQNYSSAHHLAIQWGRVVEGDVPVPGDYDGDGKTDPAVWRASTGAWYWLQSSTGFSRTAFGSVEWGVQALGDVPVPGDYDGDGRTDPAVWRASTGTWYWLRSMDGYSRATSRAVEWGVASLRDEPVPADYDGDGLTDPAVWRASTGTWFWLQSRDEHLYRSAGQRQWGVEALGDRPVPGDWDGDGRSDLAVWRRSTGVWYLLMSTTGYSDYFTLQWGQDSTGDRLATGTTIKR